MSRAAKRWTKDLSIPLRAIGWYSLGVGNGAHDRRWILAALVTLGFCIWLEWKSQKENPNG